MRERQWTYISGLKIMPRYKVIRVALYPTPYKNNPCKLTISTPRVFRSSSVKLRKMNRSLDLLPSSGEIESSSVKGSEPTRDRRKSLNTEDPDNIAVVKIYDIWKSKLAKDETAAECHWKRLRKLGYDGLEAFAERLKFLEEIVQEDDVLMCYLDLEGMRQKQKTIHDAYETLDDFAVEFQQVSKAFQNIAQFMPPTPERASLKARMSASRKRYYVVLDALSRKQNILHLMVPLLEIYKELGSKTKSWLDTTESRSGTFITKYNDHNIILHNEEVIESILDEVYNQKEIYENFLESGEKIIDLNKDYALKELREDLNEVTERWDLLLSNLEKCVNRLAIAKKIAEENKKQNNTEKIEQKIRSEAQLCICHTPFQIIRIGEGKYTFGTSKIVRLVRIHGSSIVVRVGGGWEFLYEFLLKADPCRAKQISERAHKGGLQSLHLTGLNLSNMDTKDGVGDFSLNVQRLSRTSYTPSRNQRPDRSGSLGSAASSENMEDGVDDSVDMSLSTSSGSMTPQSVKTKQFTPKSTSSRKQSPEKRLSSSITNINKTKSLSSTSRRVSLIERQSAYAEKRKSQSFTVDS